MPLNELSSTLGIKRAAHLLRRTCFGANIAEIEEFAALTPAQAIQRLFDTTIPNPPLPVDPMTGNEWISGEFPSASENSDLMGYFLAWTLGQMTGNHLPEEQKLPYIFRERLVYFLHTHFTVRTEVVRDPKALYFQQALFRLFAFDKEDIIIPPENPDDPESTETIADRNFKQLTKKISVDNAMLFFLDGRLNVKGSPNENYSRELLELYSIGRGLEGTLPPAEFDGDYFYFTEQDVQEGARVLSGFDIDRTYSNLDPETNLPRGIVRGGEIASSHEEGEKTFSVRFQNAVVTPNPELEINGRPTKESILDEISQFVDIIYNQRETSIHTCRELYRFFVYHEITPALQESVISDMADIFEANNYKIQPVLESLLTSTHFYEAEEGATDNNFGGLIKSPLELTIGFIRNFEVTVPDYETEIEAFHEFMGTVLRALDNQGLDYYNPFEVAGYSAYHQFPIYNRSWITTNFLTNRYNFIRERIKAEMMEEMPMGSVAIMQFVENQFPLTTIRIAEDFIVAVARYFLPVSDNLSFDTPDVGELTVERLNYFKSALFEFDIDENPEAAWTIRWDNNLDPETRANQLKDLFNAMLQSPEYQLM